MVWFRLNIGRERNADPRWLVPLICRAGEVTKGDIGTIRIDERHTMFQIAAESADQFELAARSAKKKEGQIVRLREGDGQPKAEERQQPKWQKVRPHVDRDGSKAPAREHEHARDKGNWPDGKRSTEGGWGPRRRPNAHADAGGSRGESGRPRRRKESA